MWASILSNWKIVAGGAAIVALSVFVYLFIARGSRIDDLLKENGAIKTQLDESVSIANQNAASLEAFKKEADRNNEMMLDAQKKSDDRVAAARKRERELLNVEKSKDGSVAPVLYDTLIRLRGNAGPIDRKD